MARADRFPILGLWRLMHMDFVRRLKRRFERAVVMVHAPSPARFEWRRAPSRVTGGARTGASGASSDALGSTECSMG